MNNEWLDIGVLEDYLDGKLDAKTMNRVEREALEDPFVAEALAGLSMSPKRSLQSISLLQKQLQERISGEQVAKKTRIITWQRLSIAATAAVLFISVSIIFWMKENARQQQLANRPKKVEVSIAPMAPDTIPSVTEGTALAKLNPASDAASVEVDRAVRAAKTNTYAANKTKKETADMVVAEDAAQQLNEVAVVGYAPQMKKSVMAASATLRTAARSWSGKVADISGEPIPGAIIHIEGTNLAATTDKNGEFNLQLDSTVKTDKVKFSAIGFQSKEFIVQAGQPADIRLMEENNALSEVVVTGYSKNEKVAKSARREKADTNLYEVLQGKVAGVVTIQGVPSFNDAISKPVEGWDGLFKYLSTHNKFRKERNLGRQVELSFSIGKNGRPADIKVIKSVEARYDEEAVRLMLKGPKWEQTKAEGDRMTFRIAF